MWEMLRDGAKTWEARKWETGDDRCYRLSWGRRKSGGRRVQAYSYAETESRWRDYWAPEEKEVSFLNKDTGEVLTFEYRGVEFLPWAPAWGFILLGELICHKFGTTPEEEGNHG